MKTAPAFQPELTDAQRFFEFVEDGDWPSPVDSILILMRRVMGRLYGYHVNNHVRKDREFWVFEFPDGSVIGFYPRPEDPVLSPEGEPWPWLVALEDRQSWELFIQCPEPPVVDHSLVVRW